MDWDSQPNPFRRYDQAVTFPLDHPPVTDTPTYDSLFGAGQEPYAPINRASISRLFYESLAISAWKQAGENRWSLRVNPSSGDLHPTEAYLIAGSIKDLTEVAAVFHYSAYEHAMERRVILTSEEWDAIGQNLPPSFVLVALASIYWRESWKYGERAFRYCHHDVGHAIAAPDGIFLFYFNEQQKDDHGWILVERGWESISPHTRQIGPVDAFDTWLKTGSDPTPFAIE